ncbi:MAG: hypothetical protein SFW67_05855 [Myxococcaceae bacterium]|nr:hypothetical protein [Myxococcaceae bacterium]
MSEPAIATDVVAVMVGTPASPERKAQVTSLVEGILKHMEYPARLELKDMPDGGIGIAVHFDGGELPGITPGKRSWLLDCIQFLVNKAINRPQVEKRWVSLGANAFPEPRPPRPEKEPPAPKASAPARPAAQTPPAGAASAKAPPMKANGAAPKAESGKDAGHSEAKGRRGHDADERALEVKDDPALTKLFATLAEKSAKTGRLFAVMSLSADDRARALKAAAAVKGVSVRAEGEGYFRRVTFTPEKLTPMPSKKQVMPDYDDEEE